MSTNRLFTLEEATQLLPTVRQLLIEIRAAKAALDVRTAELDRLAAMTGGNGHLAGDMASARKAIEAAGVELERLMAELDDLGVELKGIDDGLIDFPTTREGRVVYLCWRLGEDEIAWWHDVETGFAGRQPL
ncbi:MAG TPA: DUF2203 domain-containing protein [Dehalococcoidia bacterium]|nr:DUF2203 domain-containing protein [Dehalococcoidia bacterium]